MGTILSMIGLDMALRINNKLEKKVMEDYSKLIDRLEEDGENTESEFIKLLMFNYIDEHLHTSLFDTLIGAKDN